MLLLLHTEVAVLRSRRMKRKEKGEEEVFVKRVQFDFSADYFSTKKCPTGDPFENWKTTENGEK